MDNLIDRLQTNILNTVGCLGINTHINIIYPY